MQEDYFMRHIDAMGKALASLFSKMLSLNGPGRGTPKMEMVRESFKEELSIDLAKLISIVDNDFISYLQNNISLSEKNFERLADIFIELGKESNNPNIYRKALILLEYASGHSENFDFEREEKIQNLKDLSG